MKLFYVTVMALILIVSACAPGTEETPTEEKEPSEVDVVGQTSKTPGEPEEVEEIEEVEEQKEMTPEVRELLEVADTKVKSLRYSYKGPETEDFFYDFFVKGNNVKYNLDPTYKVIDVDDDAYDTVYLDKELKTAQAYCDHRSCRAKGKKADLNYDEANILTPLDWLAKVEFAEKVGEELIEGRYDTWKLSTNQGTMWIDNFYGIPLQVESDGKLYRFQQRAPNDLKDEDVVPG